MAYIFLDESGDLGFDFSKKKASQYFLVTFLFVENKRSIEKVVKKVFSGFTRTQIKAHHGVLHAHKETPRTRRRVLNELNGRDFTVLAICLNKRKVYAHLKDEKPVLYNYVTNILLDRILTKKLMRIDQEIKLVASRRETNKFLNENFKEYLTNQVKDQHKLKIEIEIKAPHQEKCLQVVDMLCWSLFREIERKDRTYSDLIQDKVIEKSWLFP